MRQELDGRRIAGAVGLVVEAAVRQERRRVDLVDGADQRRAPAEVTGCNDRFDIDIAPAQQFAASDVKPLISCQSKTTSTQLQGPTRRA